MQPAVRAAQSLSRLKVAHDVHTEGATCQAGRRFRTE